MVFKNSRRRLLGALLASGFTAMLLWFGTGLDPRWPLLWFAPLPVLLFALSSSWRDTALVAFLSSLAGSLNLWGYMRLQGAPFVAWLTVFSIAALVFSLGVLLFRSLAQRGALWSALFAFPATWVSYEFVRNLTTVHATSASFAYSQLDFLPFLQLASITGPWGMTFVLLLFPSALAIGLHLRKSAPKQAMQIAGTVVVFIVLILANGAVRLFRSGSDEELRVGLIATDVNLAVRGEDTKKLFEGYAEKAEQLTRRGAKVIVLPEKIGVVLDSENEAADAVFQSMADKTNSTIVVGEVHVLPNASFNQARIYAAFNLPLTYNKQHMLPPFESDLTAGTTLTAIPKPSAIWGVAICKDMDFTPLSRHYGQSGVGVMFVPGWDFNVDRAWHGHMAVMRGVEDGFSVVRAAKNGYLTVSDGRGRILAEARSDSSPFAELLADVPVVHHQTLYLLLGDWFGWFAILTVAFSIVRLYRLSRSQDRNVPG